MSKPGADPARYVQIGLRGYWPGEEAFSWQREQGITSLFMHDVRERGIADVVGQVLDTIGDHGRRFRVGVGA